MKKEIIREEKTKEIRLKRPNGDIYVYERIIKYDSIKKYNVIVSNKLIGKIVKGTNEIVPTRPKRKKENEDNCTYKQRTGMMDIIAHVSEKSHVQFEVMEAVGTNIGLGRRC